MAAPDDLARWYAAAWTERDDAKRRALLESCCGPEIRFLQEGWEHEVVGVAALSDTIGEFQAGWPEGVDVRVELTTPVDSHHGFGRGGFVWIFGEDRGYGTDFVELGSDGKMKTIVVFGDPGPPHARRADLREFAAAYTHAGRDSRLLEHGTLQRSPGRRTSRERQRIKT